MHTSGTSEGQLYVPEVNWALLVACVTLVPSFGSSSKLAAAYGIAVTGTMAITSVLFFVVIRRVCGCSLLAAVPLLVLFLSVDLPFFSANVFPPGSAAGSCSARAFVEQALPLDVSMADVAATRPTRVPGTAVFMMSNPNGAPPVLIHHFKHNKLLHEQVLLLSIATQYVPEVPRGERVEKINDLGDGFYQVQATYGFLQTPNVLEVMDLCAAWCSWARRSTCSEGAVATARCPARGTRCPPPVTTFRSGSQRRSWC